MEQYNMHGNGKGLTRGDFEQATIDNPHVALAGKLWDVLGAFWF